jgi:3-phenylpropionate/cinnamic acid dioxygenase small subunit
MNLEDTVAVTDVLIRYATAVDTRNWDLFRSCFTPEAVADYGEVGRWDDVSDTGWVDCIGGYDDRLIRTADGWRIANRVFRTTRITSS